MHKSKKNTIENYSHASYKAILKRSSNREMKHMKQKSHDTRLGQSPFS